MPTAIAIAFSLFGALCVAAVPLGLPGAWLLLAGAVLLELTDGALLGVPAGGADPVSFGWWLLGGALALAALGEGLEILAGLLGAKVGGGTRRGSIGAFVGGLAGMLAGTFLLPVPILGSLVGALLGTFGGALLGELSGAEGGEALTYRQALKPALAATLGRVLGTAGKTGVAGLIWLMLSLTLFLA